MSQHEPPGYNTTDKPRFRSERGTIRSTDPNAFRPRLTTTHARMLLNELYVELAKHDRAAADAICRKHNA